MYQQVKMWYHEAHTSPPERHAITWRNHRQHYANRPPPITAHQQRNNRVDYEFLMTITCFFLSWSSHHAKPRS